MLTDSHSLKFPFPPIWEYMGFPMGIPTDSHSQGNPGKYTSPECSTPQSIAIDSETNNVYICDSLNYRI